VSLWLCFRTIPHHRDTEDTEDAQRNQAFVQSGSDQEVAKNAISAGISNHNSPFTRKNIKPQKPSRLIHLPIFDWPALSTLLHLHPEYEFRLDRFVTMHAAESNFLRDLHPAGILIFNLEV
jgi:hypothetical protein